MRRPCWRYCLRRPSHDVFTRQYHRRGSDAVTRADPIQIDKQSLIAISQFASFANFESAAVTRGSIIFEDCTEQQTLSLAGFVVLHRDEPADALVAVVVLAVSGRLAKIDFAEHRLPNHIVGPLALFVAAATVVSAQ